MAATVQTRNTYVSSTSDASSFDLSGNMPASISAGDLLVVVCAVDGNPTVTAGSDWTKMGQALNGSTVCGAIFWKFAAGSDTITITTSSAQQMSAVLLRISGAGTPTGSSANGSSTNSNPPNHSSGDTSTLWIATRSGDSTVVATVAPTNYGNLQTATAGGTSGASTNTAERTTSATSENPGTFTSNTEQWVSWTIGIPDKPTTFPYVTGFGGSAPATVSSITQSVYIPFDNSTLVAGPSAYDSTVADTAISSITYNGVAMTQLEANALVGSPDGSSNYLYSIPNLSAGTHDLVVTFVGTCDAPVLHWCVFANADTAHSSDAHILVSNGSATPQTGALTTVLNNSRVWSWIGFGNVGGGSTTGSDQFETGNFISGYSVASFSKTIKVTAGSVTHQYTPSSSDTADIFLVSISPYVAPVVSTSAHAFMTTNTSFWGQ